MQMNVSTIPEIRNYDEDSKNKPCLFYLARNGNGILEDNLNMGPRKI